MAKPIPSPKRVQQNLDPHNINGRLYNQIHRLLEEVERDDVQEHITVRERIAMIIAVARIQTVFVSLRKEKADDDAIVGSKVRKYQTTFQTNDTRGRKTGTGPAAVEPEADLGISLDSFDDEGDND